VASHLELIALENIPLIHPGDDVAAIIAAQCQAQQCPLQDGDIVVIAQKIISKAENRYVHLSDVTPSPAAEALAAKTHKDPRQVEVVLQESSAVVRHRPGVIIVRHKLGFVHANAGIDQSNIANENGETLLLLPENPDRSAHQVQQALQQQFSGSIGVIVNDSFGRPWRMGTTGVAIGCAGIAAVDDQRGDDDLFGRELAVTQVAVADEIAAAASLLMGQAAEARPVVIVRGWEWQPRENASVTPLIRALEEDLFQ